MTTSASGHVGARGREGERRAGRRFGPARVLYHHRTQCRGAEGVHVRGIAMAFAEAGWEVDVLAPPGVSSRPAGSRGALDRTEGLTGRLLRWFSRRAPEIVFEVVEILYNVWALFRLSASMRKFQYNLIYERYSLFLAAGVVVARSRGVPIVVEVNDSVTIERSRRLALQYLATRMERWTLRNATLVITVSQPLKRRLMNHGLAGERVVVTPNAVDPSEWPDEPDQLSKPAEDAGRAPVVFGCVAAFVNWHRPDLLIEGISEVMSCQDVLLVMVGDGPARPAAQQRARELGCEQHVDFTGFVSHERVRTLLLSVDVAVIPHSNDHGSPMKLFEYMAAGKAIIAPACEPIREVVEHGKTALLFEPLDRCGLTEAMVTLARDPALRRRLGENARRRVREKHTWSRNLHRVLDRLEAVTSVPSGRTACL